MRYALLVVLLAGCATAEQQAENVVKVYGPYCDKLGYARDSDAWRDCVRQQSNLPKSRFQRLIDGA